MLIGMCDSPFVRRVPTLVLDDGGVLVESAAILDHLDELAGPERSLLQSTYAPFVPAAP